MLLQYLLRFVLCPRTEIVLEKLPWAAENNMYQINVVGIIYAIVKQKFLEFLVKLFPLHFLVWLSYLKMIVGH